MQLGHEVLQDRRIGQSLAMDGSFVAGKLDNTNVMRYKAHYVKRLGIAGS